MEITKETLSKKIIPSLFYNRTGTTILENIQTELENKGLSKSEILKKFNRLNEIRDGEFWTFFVEFFNEAFKSRVEVKVDNEDEFKEMILSLQKIKFDSTFIETDSMKVTNKDLLLEYLKDNFEIKEGVVNLSDDSIYRLVVPIKKKYSVNTSYYEPKELTSYPNNFIKIEGNKISIDMSYKSSRSAFFKGVKASIPEDSEETIIEEFVQDHLNNLKVDVHSFFKNLRLDGLYIKKAKFSNPSLYFNIGLKELIDFEELIDSDFFISSNMDLISFKKIQFLYSKLIGSKSHDFIINVDTLFKELGSNKYVKFLISFSSDKALDSSIENEVKEIFQKNGLYFDQSYELPSEYYINNIFHDIGSLKLAYEKLQQVDPENAVLKSLLDKNILTVTDGEITINTEELVDFKNETLKQLENEQITVEGNDYKILSVFVDDKKRQCLTIRITNNNSHDTGQYDVIIYPDVRSYEKVTSIVLPHLNYAFIVNKILGEDKVSALNNICFCISLYLKNKYNLVLEKEANNSYTFLKNYSENWSTVDLDLTPQKAGNFVEMHLNILLKSIYRNYLLIGGKRAPDGYLSLLNNNYLLDSKQHTSIAQGEFDKVVRYVFTYSLSRGLRQTDYGVFVVCRGKIGNSLNQQARQTWQGCPQFNDNYKLAFLTIEYFLKIHELLKDSRVKSNPDLLKNIFESFHTIVSASTTMNNSSDLVEKEDTLLNGLEHSVREEAYTPQRQNQV